jgi:hypothetical protein
MDSPAFLEETAGGQPERQWGTPNRTREKNN